MQGYADRLAEALATLGADLDHGAVPQGLAIIQVGDLVHKGPERAIGQPKTAAESAEILNDEFERDPTTALAAGRDLDFGDEPGVVWADACAELLSSWADMQALPFWTAVVDPATRHTTIAWPDGHGIVGIDPGYVTDGADVPVVPLMLTTA